MNVLLLILIYLAYLALSLSAVWSLASWAQRRQHPAVLAGAWVVTLAAVGLCAYAFAGTVPLPQRQPWQALLGHVLEPFLGLLLALPCALCVAAAQTCVRLAASPRLAQLIALALGALTTGLAPLALIASAQGLAGVSL